MDAAAKGGTDDLRFVSKRIAQKRAEAIDLIGYKIAEKIACVSNKSTNAYEICEEPNKVH